MFDQQAVLRVKPIYPVYRVTDTSFRIGAQVGVTAEIDDPDGQVWTLVKLLDGTRTFGEIVAAMQADYPALSAADVAEGIRALDQEGFLEDARPTIYETADPQLIRFVGNVNYFSHFAQIRGQRAQPQDLLRQQRVVLLGLGGAGSNILPLLAALGIGEIVAVDYDRVEASNLNRQFLYRERDIGELKTMAAARVMAEMNTAVRFTPITRKIEAAEDVRDIIHGADLVICAIDEPPFLAQRRVNLACCQEDVPCLYGLMQITSGRMFTVVPRQSGCFDCLNIHYLKHDPLFLHQFKGFQAARFNAPTITFAPDITRLCGAIAAEAVRLLTGYLAPQSIGVQVELDFEHGTTTPLVRWPRYELDCPTCGQGQADDWPIFALYPGLVARGLEQRV